MTQLLKNDHTQEQAEVMMPETAFTADSSSINILLTTCPLPIKDHLNTIHAMVDSSGNLVEQYTYDAWGRVLSIKNGSGTSLTKSAIGNRYLFTGREYSYSTGLYYYRARFYDPNTGRFISKDPIGITGGLNEYRYCSNDPVNRIDPSGLDDDSWGDKYDEFRDDVAKAIFEPLDNFAKNTIGRLKYEISRIGGEPDYQIPELRQGPEGRSWDDLVGLIGMVKGGSTRGMIKRAGLPNVGRIRYLPPRNYKPTMPLPKGPNNGYIDRFGNEWVKGSSRTAGESYEWDVQLSNTGNKKIGWLSSDGAHVNVSQRGVVTH